MVLFYDQNTTHIIILWGILVIVIVIAYYNWSFTYWKRKGLKVPFRPVIPFGHISSIIMKKLSVGEQLKVCYENLRALGLKHGGIYLLTTPCYVVADPDLIRNIMKKDFQHFPNHGLYTNDKDDPLGHHLFAQEDDKWKHMRSKICLAYTPAKIKTMFQALVKLTPNLVNILDDYAKSKSPFEVKELLTRFNTDCISSCVFGIKCKAMENPNCQFIRYGKVAIQDIGFIESIKIFTQFVLPHEVLRFFSVKLTNKSVEKFILNVVSDIIEYRNNNSILSDDLMHILLQIKNGEKCGGNKETNRETVEDGEAGKGHLSLQQVAAQLYFFFLAGLEMASVVNSFALYELAKDQEMQQKLNEEINSVLESYGGEVAYDAIDQMVYLEKVVQESLRKYPPISFLLRVCSKDYKVPDSDVLINKGTRVVIPIFGLQRDSEYFSEPEVFNPERFSKENKSKIHPFTFMPFGEGPRLCIGMRFGLLQSKIGLVTILRNHKVFLNERTKEPIILKKTGLTTAAQDGIWLNVEKICE